MIRPMPSNYVSATFEVGYQAPPIDAYRCIVRCRDDGPVPPVPTPAYFPTHSNLLRDFLIFEHVNDVVGERLVGIATFADITTYGVQRLNRLVDPTADFLAAGVQAGDLVQFDLSNPEAWVSSEYPDASLRFAVGSVIDATTIEFGAPLPAWRSGLSWSIEARSLTRRGTGRTVRSSAPAPLERFRDRRYQAWFGSSPDLDAFVAATKTSLDILALTATQADVDNAIENYTSTYPRTVLGTPIGG